MASKRRRSHRKAFAALRRTLAVLSHDGLITYCRGHAAGRREAEEKASREVGQLTPQDLERNKSEERRAWLEAPEQAALFEADQLAKRFFHLACYLMNPQVKEDVGAELAAQVFDIRRRLIVTTEDTHRQRLEVFIAEFCEQVRRDRQVWSIHRMDVDETSHLPTDPTAAAYRRAEIEENKRRGIREAPAFHAQQVQDYFARTYPDDGTKIDVAKLTEALEAAASADGRPGRRPGNAPGRYQLISEAIARTTFHVDARQVQDAMREALRARSERSES
jgi:hypothetical protein